MRSTFRAFVLSVTLVGPTAAQSGPTDARLLKADSLFLAREFKDALTLYATVAKTATLDPRSRFRYGMSLANTGSYQAAAAILDQAAVNNNPAVLFNAGSVHARLGHADTAFGYLNSAVTRGFSNPTLFAADSNFATLRNDPRYATVATRLRDAFTPCTSNPEFHKFDFWVGEWTVINA